MRFKHCAFLILILISATLADAQDKNYINLPQVIIAKAKFPNSNFVDLEREILVEIEASDDPDQPFFWKVTQNIQRISISNQRTFKFQSQTHDFIRDDRSRFWKVEEKDVKSIRIDPVTRMVESEGMFHSNYKYNTYLVNVGKPGEIFKITNTQLITSFAHLSLLGFSSVYPCMSHTITIEVPDALRIRIDSFNFENQGIRQSVKVQKKHTVYTFSKKYVDAWFRDEYAPGNLYYEPTILIVPLSYEVSSGQRKRLFNDVNDVYKWQSAMAKLTRNESGELRGLVDSLSSDFSEEKKLKNIYYWNQDYIRYLAFENGLAAFVPDAAQHVYYKKFGDCKGKSNLLKEMLLLAGFDARLVWIGTRNHSFMDVSTPTISTCNHMITAVKWKGEWLFLDPTSQFSPLYELSDQIQGKSVIIEGEDKPILAEVPVLPAEKNKISSRANLVVDNKSALLSGLLFKSFEGIPASSIRADYSSLISNDREEILNIAMIEKNQNLRVSLASNSLDVNRDTVLSMDAAIDVEHSVLYIGDDIYLPTTLFPRFENADISLKRRADFTFDYKRYYLDTLNYTLPDDYVVDYLPDNLKIAKDKYEYSVTTRQEGKNIQIISKVILNDFIIRIAEFQDWNTDLAKLKIFYRDKIILKRTGE